MSLTRRQVLDICQTLETITWTIEFDMLLLISTKIECAKFEEIASVLRDTEIFCIISDAGFLLDKMIVALKNKDIIELFNLSRQMNEGIMTRLLSGALVRR